jgi:hypothetical protein
VPEVSARPDFVADLRERLMAEADTALVAATTPDRLALPTRTRPRDRRLAVVLGGAALVGATTTVAVAAQTALPGESLYGVKQAMESVQVRLASDDAERGRALLGSAERRLDELEALTEQDPAGAGTLVPDTLDDFGRQAGEGGADLLDAYRETGDRALAEEVRAFAADGIDRLDRLESSLPPSARDELLAAGRQLADLDAAAAATCPVCGGGITELPDFLLTSAAQADLPTGVGGADLQLEPAPVSGQDVTGLEVPEDLDALTDQVVQPTAQQTDPAQVGEEVGSTVGETVRDPIRNPVKDAVKDTVKNTVEDPVGTVTGTSGTLTNTVDEATGGAVGGLVGGADDATGGLIGDVTGTLDGATGGLLDDATGGVLP